MKCPLRVPIVGTVLSTSPICSLYKIVVLPAASKPSITTYNAFEHFQNVRLSTFSQQTRGVLCQVSKSHPHLSIAEQFVEHLAEGVSHGSIGSRHSQVCGQYRGYQAFLSNELLKGLASRKHKWITQSLSGFCTRTRCCSDCFLPLLVGASTLLLCNGGLASTSGMMQRNQQKSTLLANNQDKGEIVLVGAQAGAQVGTRATERAYCL